MKPKYYCKLLILTLHHHCGCSFPCQPEDGTGVRIYLPEPGYSGLVVLLSQYHTGGTWQGGPSLESHQNQTDFSECSHISQPQCYPFGPCRAVWKWIVLQRLSPAFKLTNRSAISVWIPDLLAYIVLHLGFREFFCCFNCNWNVKLCTCILTLHLSRSLFT